MSGNEDRRGGGRKCHRAWPHGGRKHAHLAPVLASLPFLACASLALRPEARAHVVYGTRTFYQMTVESDLVMRGRITEGEGLIVIDKPPLHREVVKAQVLEVLRGGIAVGESVTFAQHGHGHAGYADGEEALLFLEKITRSPELSRTAIAERVQWVSRQEPQDRVTLTPQTRDEFVAAVKAYAALAGLASPRERIEGLRLVTLRLLGSREPRIAASAVRDLVLAGNLPIVRAADAALLDRLIDDPHTAIAIRIALLAEIERRSLVSGPPRWARLLRETTPRDLLPLVRAVGAHPSDATTEELVKILEGNDAELAAAAAVSLGSPGNERAVEPLTRALSSASERVRMGAIRGLGGIGTEAALRALEQAATSHPDPVTRRRARAEATVLSRRQTRAVVSSPKDSARPIHHHGVEPETNRQGEPEGRLELRTP